MSYTRKTRDVFEVRGLYNGIWERLTTEYTKTDAIMQKKCYDENEYTIPHRIKKVREKVVNND